MKSLRFILLAFLFGNSLSNYAQEPSRMQEVVDIHDEIMPKMSNLVKLINQLQPKVDSTKTGQKHQQAIKALKASNKSMMTWMQGFGERFTADEMMKGKALNEEKKIWLDEEYKKVKALRKEINSSIKKAEQLLEQ
ncbi:hypothetical protein FEE95_11535 [Maribacter algarum]|uniref:Viral A-type inclusion protein n=1 Tax=Maribacter algarum (ex Zhang et al. 2020) TaxID=2578118 RepID=A0A5S3PQU6_9FLAO|nr:hypothetical protein [Maribacter algarum]TMM57116.1 hypothetical protein FEE95_11535 [Maribacter algarum]